MSQTDIIKALHSGLERIEALWVQYNTELEDEYDEGFADALADCAAIARSSLREARKIHDREADQ